MEVRIGSQTTTMGPADWQWTSHPRATDLANVGDIVYVRVTTSGGRRGLKVCALEQDSGAQASMMAVDNSNGEVLAMVGGRDFALSQFNRATQAERQVGSCFKSTTIPRRSSRNEAVRYSAGYADDVLDAGWSVYAS